MPIPKIIHYCWFGGNKKPEKVNQCINSWKAVLTDYMFKEWNETNFDYDTLLYTRQAYERKKYAFVSDVARVQALREYGGIYLDTDVMVYKKFDSVLDNHCVLGFEWENYVATSFMAAEKGHSLMTEMAAIYDDIPFCDQDGHIIQGTNVSKLTKLLVNRGLKRDNTYQKLDGGTITVYPQEYFSPYDYVNCTDEKSENTICEHLFFVSWMSKKEQAKKIFKKTVCRVFGKRVLIGVRKVYRKVKGKILHLFILIIILCFIGVMIGNIWVSYHCLQINYYRYNTNKTEKKCKIIVLSDLHDHSFGKDNQKLVSKVKEQFPDIILLDGDMLNDDSADSEVPCRLVKQFVKIAPVYYALGNHEVDNINYRNPKLLQELTDAGAVILDKRYEDIDIHGTTIRLGGMYDYAFGQDGNDTALTAPQDDLNFLRDFQDTDSLKLMLAHRPDSFIFGDASKTWEIDLVISGHNHGGQVVIPFLGGLYGGNQGWFPKYLHGLYKKESLGIFITSGLGSHGEKLPRFHNPPEIAVLEIE